MADRNQMTIGVNRKKYDRLSERKETLEEATGRHFDWGTFLLILAGLQSADEFADKEQNKFVEMHSNEGEEANLEDYEEISGWVSKEEVEEIVKGQADRIITELKG